MKRLTKLQKEQKKLEALEQDFIQTQKAYHEMCKKRDGIWKKMNESKERLVELEREAFDISAGFTEDYIKWLLKFDDTASKSKEFTTLYNVTNGQLQISGYFAFTNQNALRLRLCKDENFYLAEEYLNKFLPHYLPLPLGDDYNKVVDIFEKTCSEFGSYRLSITEKMFTIYKSVYGRDSIVKEFDNLHDTLSYISKYIYY